MKRNKVKRERYMQKKESVFKLARRLCIQKMDLPESVRNTEIADKITGLTGVYHKGTKKSVRRIISEYAQCLAEGKTFSWKKGFYSTREWRELRYKVISASNGLCTACGAKAGESVRLHVDHIKPRSKYPELELDINNLQVLCEDCNLGKSNKDDTDFREVKND